MTASSKIDVAICGKLINAASQSCAAPVDKLPAHADPPWEALANSFAALSAAFTWGTILIALLAVLFAVGWGVLVKVWAEREAKREAAECVKKQMDKWLAEEAPQIVRRHVENLQRASLGDGDEDQAADQMGQGAG